ncbi:MAG TPA: hypothetical protein VLB12_10775 [Gemmatimonadales bacterium]|nr:hypothetical protein [Gemmatimonadales bacterium]
MNDNLRQTMSLIPLLMVLSGSAPGVLARSSDPCALLTRDEVTAVLQAQVEDATPDGPYQDDETGASQETCVYQAGENVLVVSVETFPTSAEAEKAMTRLSVAQEVDSEDTSIVVTEAPQQGKAYWASTAKAATIIAQHDARTISVGVKGSQLSKPESYRAALRKALRHAVGRV